MIVTSNRLNAALLVAGFVLFVSSPVVAQSEKRTVEIDLGLAAGKMETTYAPSKSAYQKEVAKQQKARQCLIDCKATKTINSQWRVRPLVGSPLFEYSSEQDGLQIHSWDEFTH